MILSAVITEAEEGGYIAHNPETRTTPRGETFDEAIENLREATGLYLEEFPMKAERPLFPASGSVTAKTIATLAFLPDVMNCLAPFSV